VLDLLSREFENAMALAGAATIPDINEELLA
jgi:isopentenyl diphosphate isomerase/L-lactate dehydrogenase-like FMN-dependent dehydrogenase